MGRRMPESDSAESKFHLGKQYYLEKQHARAYKAFEEAAAADHPAALRVLGEFFYLRGFVVPKDVKHATELLERAVALGDGYARAFLGRLLIHGASGRFLGGISRPRQVLRGLRLIFSTMVDVWVWKKTTWDD